MSHNFEDEMRERMKTEKLIEEIQESARRAGYKVYSKEEQLARAERSRIREKREAKFRGFLGFLRTVFYSPLSIAFHAVSFVARAIAGISSIGLIAGVYYLCQSFCALREGVALAEVNALSQAAGFIVFPFIAYFLAEITDRIWLYFYRNAHE